jgi:hypothetical protein
MVVFMDVTSSWSKCGMCSAGCCSFRLYYHKALANWSSWNLQEILLLQRVFIQGHVSLYESPSLLFCWAVMTHYDACEMEPLKMFLCLCIHFFRFSIILTTQECYVTGSILVMLSWASTHLWQSFFRRKYLLLYPVY